MDFKRTYEDDDPTCPLVEKDDKFQSLNNPHDTY